MEIINPNGMGNPFGDVQPMGCGTDALAPLNLGGGGEGVGILLTVLAKVY